MSVLLVDDEPGIRDGLAAWFRLQGLEVATAGDVASALERLPAARVVVTDWRLPDGDALAILAAARVPVVVVSGHPGEVDESRAALVLRKPVAPRALHEHVAALLDRGDARPAPRLRRDVAARFEAFRRLVAAAHARDDGPFVVLCGHLPPEVPPEARAALAELGGDLRLVRTRDATRVTLRLFADGRPAGTRTAVRPDDRWPEEACAVEFDGAELGDAELDAVLRRCAERDARGLGTWFVNVPDDLERRLLASGNAARLPKRASAGPRLPEIFDELWS